MLIQISHLPYDLLLLKYQNSARQSNDLSHIRRNEDDPLPFAVSQVPDQLVDLFLRSDIHPNSGFVDY
jgi:hypothetical protein